MPENAKATRLFNWGAKLFWLIEIFRHDDNNEDNLCNYDASSSEPALTYMFAMVFLQNIPQAILQIFLLARGTTKSFSINIAQCACALVSLLLGSIGAATYHRYSSQIVAGGRPPVWPTLPTENRRHTTTGYCQSQPLVPTRQTNKCWQKGLQGDTPAGKCLLILFWTLFLSGRTVVIGIMLRFYPKIVLLVLSLHVVLFLLYYSSYSTINIFNKIFLACTAMFVLVEVGIKFQRTVYLYMLFIVSSVVEDIGLTIVWYVWGGWSRQWFNHAAYAVINCHLLALIVFAYYMAFEKPRTVYVRNRR
ncbi:hypothetical protein LSTR_LSTR003505 [Laodelphax striatellus]|uniref:XK-related protein n=1 Tax=Laodelphax striatellus TaxID=195883 RepID=A0A482X936_LAOST|nr:hypothetical protein LSTR_LSTR003505 [Laodelphax striatellus]